MTRANHARAELSDLVDGRPGWRLEQRTTPGASPLWCFVAGGAVELSVTAEAGSLRLYVMATDEEIVLGDAAELRAWLEAHRAEALQDAPPRPGRRARFKGLFEWG